MKHDSFNADLRSVFQRLAATRQASAMPDCRNDTTMRAKLIPFQPRALQPRLEIAHVALRPGRREAPDAAT